MLVQDLVMVEAELATLDVQQRLEDLQRQATETKRQIQALHAHQLEQAPDSFERMPGSSIPRCLAAICSSTRAAIS